MTKKKRILYSWWHVFLIAPVCTFSLMIPLIIMLPEPECPNGFKTMSKIKEYASHLNETVEMENNNAKYPSFDHYYKTHFTPTLFKDFGLKLHLLIAQTGLINPPAFSAHFFKTVLESVLETRLSQKLSSPFIQKIDCSPDSKFIIFGEVQGAFHSLTRDLEQLKKLNLIDEELTIIHPKTFIVFLGNTSVRSPFSMQTLAMVLRLMYNNPNNVIYLKGTQECEKEWRMQSLKKELILCAHKFSSDGVPFEKELNTFFNTLPYAFYVAIPFMKSDDMLPVIKMTPSINDDHIKSKINEVNFADFLARKTDALECYSMLAAPLSLKGSTQVKLAGTITEIKKRDDYVQTDGLRMLPPVGESVAWTVFSSPTHAAHVALNFFRDAFAVLVPGATLDDWKITLYSRDIRDSNQEFSTKSYNFFGHTE